MAGNDDIIVRNDTDLDEILAKIKRWGMDPTPPKPIDFTKDPYGYLGRPYYDDPLGRKPLENPPVDFGIYEKLFKMPYKVRLTFNEAAVGEMDNVVNRIIEKLKVDGKLSSDVKVDGTKVEFGLMAATVDELKQQVQELIGNDLAIEFAIPRIDFNGGDAKLNQSEYRFSIVPA